MFPAHSFNLVTEDAPPQRSGHGPLLQEVTPDGSLLKSGWANSPSTIAGPSLLEGLPWWFSG